MKKIGEYTIKSRLSQGNRILPHWKPQNIDAINLLKDLTILIMSMSYRLTKSYSSHWDLWQADAWLNKCLSQMDFTATNFEETSNKQTDTECRNWRLFSNKAYLLTSDEL